MPGPDYGSIICQAWGWPNDSIGLLSYFASAANITVGANPAYSVVDVLAIYPKFFGPSLAVTLALTSGSPNAVLPATNDALASGQLITGKDIAAGTTIVSVTGTAVVLSANATATNAAEAALFYASPPIPLAVLNVFINLASASIMQSRYQDGWALAMALFIAHYATLWTEPEGIPTAGQIAQQGLARGIQVSKTVADTSVTYQALTGFEDWGAWNLTKPGQLFMTMARVIGAGPMLIW